MVAGGLTRPARQRRNAGLGGGAPFAPGPLERCGDREVALDNLHIAGMPPVYDRWLNGVVPTWTSLKADRTDALRGMPPWEDGAIRLAFDLRVD